MMTLPGTDIKAFILDLASRNGVIYKKGPHDDLAKVITELSGDKVEPDSVEDLLVALARAGVIDGGDLVVLLGRYLDEKK